VDLNEAVTHKLAENSKKYPAGDSTPKRDCEAEAAMANSEKSERQNAGGRLERFILLAMRNRQEASTLDVLGHALGLPDEVQALDRQHQVADLITAAITAISAPQWVRRFGHARRSTRL